MIYRKSIEGWETTLFNLENNDISIITFNECILWILREKAKYLKEIAQYPCMSLKVMVL